MEDFCGIPLDGVHIQNLALQIDGSHDAAKLLMRRSAGSDLIENWDLGLVLLLCLDRGPVRQAPQDQGDEKADQKPDGNHGPRSAC